MDRTTYEKTTLVWAVVIFGLIFIRALWMTFGG